MTITTVPVTCSATRPDGSVIAGGLFRFLLSHADTQSGLVVPRDISVAADSTGTAIAQLWPNGLGAAGTTYRVFVSDPLGGITDLGTCTVPNAACALYQILDLGAPATIDAATLAKIAAQAAAVDAGNSASAAHADRVQADSDVLAASESADIAAAAAVAATGVLADSGFIAVHGDLANIDAVAGSISNVNSVASDLTNINNVAADKTNIDVVAADLTNINTVAGDHTALVTVAGDHSAILTVASDHTVINTVAGDHAAINTVAGDHAAITTLVAVKTNIDAVAADLSNINAVQAALTNINSSGANATTATTQAGNASTSAVAAAASAASAASSVSSAALIVTGGSPFLLNPSEITADITLPSGFNAASAGPIEIANNVNVTISDNSTWSIV